MARTRASSANATARRNRSRPNTGSTRKSRTSLPRRSKYTATQRLAESDAEDDQDDAVESDTLGGDGESDDEDALSLEDDDDDYDLAIAPKRRKIEVLIPAPPKSRGTPRKRNTRARVSSGASSGASPQGGNKRSPPRFVRASPKTSKVSPRKSKIEAVTVPDGVIPDWKSPQIPFTAWSDVFHYASDAAEDTNWLLNTATICRAFFEPAMSVLYRVISLKTASKARKLHASLERSPDETLLNYRIKAKSLAYCIDVRPLAPIHQFVKFLPNLRELVIYTRLDEPPYRSFDVTTRWKYSQELFHALHAPPEGSGKEEATPMPRSLKHWEWSGRFLEGYVTDVVDMQRIHKMSAFDHLTSLSFTNFQVPSLNKRAADLDEEEDGSHPEDDAFVDAVAESLQPLTNLTRLSFESSTALTSRLLMKLPTTLEHFHMINCWEITSEDLQEFLATHGSQMQSLILKHNISLNLDFLPTLGQSCPKLQDLSMDMVYFRTHDSFDDSQPDYDFVLHADSVPHWPKTLRSVSIEHIRGWDIDIAEMFLQSLIDSAPDLADLRHINIKTMLSIPWQTRAQLRGEWRDRFEAVFLRQCDPPKPHRTIHQNPDSTGQNEPIRQKKKKRHSSPSRRSGRIAAHASDSDRNGHGLRKRGKPTYHVPDTDEDDLSESEPESDMGDEATGDDDNMNEGTKNDDRVPFIQGKCRTVNILFDNQKVREMQYGMEDFNDEDNESSDQEWDGND